MSSIDAALLMLWSSAVGLMVHSALAQKLRRRVTCTFMSFGGDIKLLVLEDLFYICLPSPGSCLLQALVFSRPSLSTIVVNPSWVTNIINVQERALRLFAGHCPHVSNFCLPDVLHVTRSPRPELHICILQ